MHQTFYVDSDEEVNSVIGRLKKSTSQYNVLVVAQRAMILQSSVSLRLIKKEMDALKKKILIVTQDERGLAMARKAGFPVKSTLDELKNSQESNINQAMIVDGKGPENFKNYEDENETALKKRDRLRNLGDSEYAATEDMPPVATPARKKDREIKREDFDFKEEKREEFSDLFAEKISDPLPARKENHVRMKSGAKKFLLIFSFLLIILLAGIFSYMFLPKAEISIIPKKIQRNINLTVKAGESLSDENSSGLIILKPVLIEEEDVASLSYQATGQKASASNKARGTIIIYNNFSEASQILVATTRFETEDGKIFRLTKNVTVPGMKVENGNNISGEIKAEVIADQPGEGYNIDPSSFKIPGFEGSPKYDKFSAKSEEKMKGGGEGGSDLKAVSQADIDKAEEETLKEIKSLLAQKIRNKAGDKNFFSEEAIEYEVLDSASFPEADSIAENFEYQIKARAKLLTFSYGELDNKIGDYIAQNMPRQDFPVKLVKAEKNFGDIKNNFSENYFEIKLVVDVILEAEIDAGKIEQELLGMNQEEVDSFMKEHPELQKIDASISPSFLADRIPRYPFRVKVIIGG
ncbi:MAG: hypothetical protein PHH24_02205 [Candidatus Moranbacteria bacterium]|jgi:hypothetical protein|nr:hypothetical protein [Candidatus Moranbacteria bacterium]MDD5651838.1 hypothetical protein [Candidatus Moranbacteria bacterium]MDX9855436.1 hypothetical protein [Candidatus Moranbacteria bacterium]